MIKAEFRCKDGESHFRIEENGRIRLILMPEDKPILIGQWNENKQFLLLFKKKANYVKKSYTLAVPKELWDGLQGDKSILTVAVNVRETGKILCASRSVITLFGYEDMNGGDDRQDYVFLDREYWVEVDHLDDALDFHEDSKAKYLANQNLN